MAATRQRSYEEQTNGAPRQSVSVALLKLARPKQWAKNVLVFAAPGAAGALSNPTHVAESVAAFVSFCLAASGTYYINDAHDAEADRAHPAKQLRPVAAGRVSVRAAYGIGIALLVTSIAFGAAVSLPLGATLLGYVVLTTSYSRWLKHVAVVDVVTVATGFVLRTVAGAAAVNVPISQWFFIVVSFMSLFMVSGKRGAEAAEMGDEAVAHRRVLAEYTPSFTAYLRAVSSGAALVAYCLWAFEKANGTTSWFPWYQLSILPFVLGVLRYELLLERGEHSAPEDIVLGDRALLGIGVAWLAVFAAGVYSG